jgi:predicted  nucleic acid-binding Zn-ribbon protein
MENDAGGATKHPQQLIFENVSPATRLLEKRRQMYEVQDALENQKARFAREEETFRKKEEQLRTKDLQLQHQLFRFNKFLQDNEAKRRRAETRAADEAAQIKAREEEIRDLEKELEKSKQLCNDLNAEVTRNMKYEEFLDLVKDSCQEYSEIQDLVTRYETLESAHKDLMELQTSSDTKIESLRNEYQAYQKDTDMEMLAMTNKVAKLQTERDEAVKDREQLGHQMDEASQEDSKHSLKFGQILMSVENLFLRCINKRGHVLQHSLTVKEEDTKKEDDDPDESEDSFRKKKQKAIQELRVILFYLKDFKEICETLKRERRNDTTRHKKEQAVEAAQKAPEIKFVVEAEHPRGDRGSQNSGSQNNTRELSKSMRDTTSGSGGDEKSKAAGVE